MKSALQFSKKDREILKDIYRFARRHKAKLYLVGGALRDLLLDRSRENPDFDFCLRRGAISFGRKLARGMKAGFVVLDKEHGACRIVRKISRKSYTLDFTDFRGPTLEEDLKHRDFTVNALALELEKAVGAADLSGQFIDPKRGTQDLSAGIIRAAGKNSFSEDPLRILRLFSFSCVLGFEIEKETLKFAKLERKKLAGVSGERIREELFKIFDSQDSFKYLSELDEAGILKIIFPEFKAMSGIGQGPYHHLDVWQHTLEAVKQLEGVLNEFKNNRQVRDYLNSVISSGRRREALLKLGALLHDIGKPLALRREEGKIKFHGHERMGLDFTEAIALRLKLSNEEIRALRTIVLWHLRPGYLSDNAELTSRAKFRFFRDTAGEAASILLLSIADQRATCGPLATAQSRRRQEKTALGLLEEYFRKKKEKKPARLVNGDILMQKFKLGPSALVGKVLSELEELQAIGKIKTKIQALRAAGKFLKRGS